MDKEAELVYGTALDSQHTMNVQDPRDDLTLAQATAVMQTVVAKNIFATKTGDLVSISEARIHTSETTPLV